MLSMKTLKNNYSSINNGYINLFLSLILGSLRPILLKLGITDTLATPIAISFLSATIAAIIVLIFNRPKLNFLKRFSLYIPGFLLLLNTILTASALKYTNLVTVVTIISLTPIVVAFHKMILTKSIKNLEWFFIGFIFAFVGILQVMEINSLKDLQINLLGIFLAASAVIVSDIYRLFVEKKSREIGSENLSSIIIICGGIFGLIYLPFNSSVVINSNLNFWGLIILLSISIAFSNLLFVKALKMVGALTTSLIYIIQPAVVVFFGVLFISEPLKMNYITGISLIIMGLFIFKFPSINLRIKEKINLIKDCD